MRSCSPPAIRAHPTSPDGRRPTCWSGPPSSGTTNSAPGSSPPRSTPNWRGSHRRSLRDGGTLPARSEEREPPPMDVPPGPPTVASLWAEVTGAALAEETLQWPPDVFAAAGTLLRRTHVYRFAVSPPAGQHWPPRGRGAWNGAVCAAAEEWAAWSEDPVGPPPALVADAWQTLRDGASASLGDLADGRAWQVSEALLTLLAVSDETCAGMA